MLQRSAKGGGLPVGAAQLMPDVGPLSTLLDGSEWLRTGWLAAASGYPVASKVRHLKAHMLTGRAPSGATATGWRCLATDGAGTYIAVDGSTANLWRSTNGGATWNQVNHNAGIALNRVIWTGAMFIAVGNTSGALVVVTSPTGAAWTLRLNAVLEGYAADTAAVATNGANLHAVIANPNGYAGWAWTSLDGVAWTNRPGMPALSSPGNTSLAVVGSTILAVAGNGARFSRDGGATWAIPAFVGWVLPVNGGFNVNVSGGSWARALAGADLALSSSWRSFIAPGVQASNAVQAMVAAGSTYYLGPGGVLRIVDDVLWQLQSLDVYGQAQNGACWAFGANDMVVLPVGAGAPYYAATSPIGVNNAVGVLPAQYTATSGNGLPVYVRIK